MNGTSDSEDKERIRRCLDGDTEAFEGLVERYQKPVFNAIYQMVQNYEDAREISQSVFMKAFVNLKAFDPQRRFFSWIYRIAMNESIDFLSARRITEPITPGLRSPAEGPERGLEASELRHHLNEAMAKLSPEYKAVLVLRHFMGCPYEEIAEVLQIPEKTVKSRLFSARHLLRDELIALGYRKGTPHA